MTTPDPRTTRHPLLAAQEGIWAGHQLDPGSPAYNTAEYVRIHGAVDPAAFEKALRHAVAEVEALNVRFVTDGTGRPWQVDAPGTDWAPHVADLTAEPDPHAAALAWMARDTARPVDLERDPLFGHALLRVAPEEYLWYHRVHHIALDGFGLSLVARRVARVYTALVEGAPLGASGYGTLESVRREEEAYRASERFAEDRAHWMRRFADRPRVASLTTGQALPARTFLRSAVDLDPDETRRLRAVAREVSATWPDLLLAATAAYVHRVSGADETVLSLPVMGRLGSVSLRVPCMVRNVLPLRVAVGERDGLRDLAARVAAEVRAGLPHQRYRYEWMRRDLKLVGGGRRLSGPGVNIMPFEYDLRFAGHRSTVHNLSAGPVDDLAVNVYDRAEGAGLRVAVDANPHLYDEADLAAHRQGLLDLLREALAAPDRPIGRRPRTVLDGGPLPHPPRPVLDLVTGHAARHGGATAVEHDGRSVTYAELLASARRLARRLTARGAGPGAVVAVALPRGIDAVTAVLGVLLSGAAYCPLDPAAPETRTRTLLDGLRPLLVLTRTPHATRFSGHPVLPLDTSDGGTGAQPGRSGDAGVPPVRDEDTGAPHAPDGSTEGIDDTDAPTTPTVALGDPAYVIHTSGSTGRPKAVEVGHGALAAFVAGASHRYGLRREDRVLQFAPLHFDASVEEIFLTLCAGATLVVRTDAMTESVPGFLRETDRLRISVLDLPTAYWHELAYALSTGAATLPDGVRTVVIGGEAALPDRVDRWLNTVGTSVRLFNTYGPTEATVVATVAALHETAPGSGDVPIGLPLPGTRAAVVGGELHLLGDALATGYRGADADDDARFAPLDRLPGSPRAFRTGDLVRLGDDGQLRFLGRVDDEFKISGHRVHPSEVEAALLAQPGVREAAVVGQVLPDGTRRLAAHVVADDPPPTAADVRERLRAVLPAAMVPSAVEFTDRLPRTGTGKIDRKALAATEHRTSPATGTAGGPEEVVTRLWAEVLGVPHVEPDDDFFDLGAHSLQAIQVANRLGVELGREVRVAWLFEHPTAAGLARRLRRREDAPAAPSADPSADPSAGTASAPTPAGSGPLQADPAPAASVPSVPPASVLADAVLEDDIRPATPPGTTGTAGTTTLPPTTTSPRTATSPRTTSRPAAPPRTVLLTGATGFVGPHLLTELLRATDAEIVCPVRAANPAQAADRVHRALADQGLPAPADAGRITAVPADLARPHLGLGADRFAELARTCDAVVHNAATVSIMREYASLRAANTGSTRLLLRMASARSIPVHLVSTLSVAPPRGHSPEVPEAFLPPHPGLLTGYQQSKWASERLLEQAAERGLPVTLHRLGRVVGAPDTGRVNRRDFLWSVLAAGIPAGIVPDLFESEVWTPADYVARAVVRLSLTAAPGTVFNHAPVAPVRLADLYDWVREYGYAVERLPLERWRRELPRSADVAATTGAFFDSLAADGTHGSDGHGREEGGGDTGPDLSLGRVRADNVLRGLEGTGIRCPQADRALVFRYLDHCVESGILPPPPGGTPGTPGTRGGSAPTT
ncbi:MULTISPECIES: non-ribosomal peptide synthetase [Streptomyces]|uniref:Non-ribosomal peptide synthetase n=1 Tax=Streptomyces sudanensis TaxID=436397 RepID=A0ABY4T7M3_9ACTN|nr:MULTISPECIES: non-ribosomal peptide synthetase [Streptomyces]URN14985.1 non-ribosomal peptide synthetase [Streptomyces sudanensis]